MVFFSFDTPERSRRDLHNAIGNLLNQLLHPFLAVRRGKLQAHGVNFEGAVVPQAFGAFQLLADSLFDHGGSMFVSGGHDNQVSLCAVLIRAVRIASLSPRMQGSLVAAPFAERSFGQPPKLVLLDLEHEKPRPSRDIGLGRGTLER